MPERHEPFYNMALVLERAGQWSRATEAYESALRLAPGDLAVMEALARTYIELGTHRLETIDLLERCLAREKRPVWQRWLTLQLIRLEGRGQTNGGARCADGR